MPAKMSAETELLELVGEMSLKDSVSVQQDLVENQHREINKLKHALQV